MNNHHEFFIKIMVDGINKRFPENKFYWRSDLEEHDNVPRVPISDPRKEGAWLIRTPDLIAEDMSGDSKIHILGEAKTYNDFSADHKRRDEQLDYYINYLKNKSSGLLVYSLPYALKNPIIDLIINKREEWNAPDVEFIVLTDLEFTKSLLL
tara:strand:- start:4472 stop:4927 length:456 start_codon:yes stop_codon:yes gene_type:complete